MSIIKKQLFETIYFKRQTTKYESQVYFSQSAVKGEENLFFIDILFII